MRHDLRLAYLVSAIVAVLMTVVSVVPLFDWRLVYPAMEPKLLPLFLGQDALNLVVGLPLLVGAMWLAHRGALIGLLLWPGALFYVLYDYGYYVLGAPFNGFFLPYLALMTLSAYAMVGIVATVDGVAVRERLATAVPARLTGGFLAGLALLFMALWVGMSVSALVSGVALDEIARVVTIMDLTVQLPALFVGGILLWRRQPLGYIVAAGLLSQAAAYLIGLSALTVLQEVVLAAPFDPIAVVPGLVVGIIGLALIGSFVRAAAFSEHAQTGRVKPAQSVLSALKANAEGKQS
jgi:hypothetical protein